MSDASSTTKSQDVTFVCQHVQINVCSKLKFCPRMTQCEKHRTVRRELLGPKRLLLLLLSVIKSVSAIISDNIKKNIFHL